MLSMGMVDDKSLAKLEWSLDKCFKIIMTFGITEQWVIVGVWGVTVDTAWCQNP